MNYEQFLAKVGENKQFVKILRSDMKHYNFTYKEGLNEDILPFNPSGSCQPGGLYFTTIDHIHEFFTYGDHIAFITLCPDAVFYIDPEGNKFKTNKFNIDKIMLFSGCDVYREICRRALTKYGYTLKWVPLEHITPELCTIAVKQNGIALNFVPDALKTPELCEIAVKQNGRALYWVPREHKTLEICELAVQQDAFAIEHIPKGYKSLDFWSYDICSKYPLLFTKVVEESIYSTYTE